MAIDRNNVDQALTVIEPVPQCTEELSTLLSTELSQFETNYVQNRTGSSQYTNLSELDFFELFFSSTVVEILFKETNSYVKFHLYNLSRPLSKSCH